MNAERRKNYKYGITPGEWMQGVTVIGIVSLAAITFYVKADGAFLQVAENEKAISELHTQHEVSSEKLKRELKEEIKESEARTRSDIDRTRGDIRELRRIILDRK